ncbi:MAG TPA: aromatic ring-hydroxylating dioxygenase subunit alpha [Thermoanaerobaculia bacterium]
MTTAAPVQKNPLDEARTLRGELYRSPAIFAEELQRLFAKLWLCVGREADVPEPGDYFTRQLGPESVLVVRGEDGKVRAFHNVCRHRGSRLVLDEEGRGLHRFQCPYHAWTYGLDGTLRNAPLMEKNACFRKDDFPLVSVRAESRTGLLFVNLDDGAPPLSRQLAGLPDLSRFRLGELRRVERLAYDVEADWKLVGENYGECYHCPLAHPHLNRVSDYRNVGWSFHGEFFNGGPMELNAGFNTLTMTGKTDRPPLTDREEDHRRVHYYHFFPGTFLSVLPDYALVHTLWPVAAGKTRVLTDWLFPDETVARDGFDASDAVEFWHLTNQQDWELCARVQLGIRSRGHRPGPYSELEGCVHTFDAWYQDYMGLQ